MAVLLKAPKKAWLKLLIKQRRQKVCQAVLVEAPQNAGTTQQRSEKIHKKKGAEIGLSGGFG